MRLIDADALLEEGIRVSYGYNDNGVVLIPMGDVRQSIKIAPTIEAEPVRHGKWTIYKECSECCELALYNANEEFVLSKYCPHCGAKMDLK